jgi:hypothetical protein
MATRIFLPSFPGLTGESRIRTTGPRINGCKTKAIEATNCRFEFIRTVPGKDYLQPKSRLNHEGHWAHGKKEEISLSSSNPKSANQNPKCEGRGFTRRSTAATKDMDPQIHSANSELISEIVADTHSRFGCFCVFSVPVFSFPAFPFSFFLFSCCRTWCSGAGIIGTCVCGDKSPKSIFCALFGERAVANPAGASRH